jgi:tetratricopeptide (TPR) repeat protein
MIALLASFAVAVLVEGNPQAAAELNNQATRLHAQAHYAEAEQLYQQALQAAVKAGPSAARTRAVTSGNLGALLHLTGRYSEAVRLLTDSVRQLQSDPSTPGPDLARMLGNLASAYQAQGDLPRAEAAVRQANEVCPSDCEAPARDRINLSLLQAAIDVDQHRYAEAEAILRQILSSATGQQSVLSYNSLSVIALSKGAYAESEELARTALDRAGSSIPREHPLVAMVLNNLAQACRFQGKYLEAETDYRQAIEIWETVVGPSHPDVAKGLMNLAGFYHERGREAGAEDLYVRSAAIFERTLGPKAPFLLVARNELADVLRAERRFAESEKLGRVSLEVMEKSFPAGDSRLLRALGNRARLLAETRRQTEANALLARISRSFQ